MSFSKSHVSSSLECSKERMGFSIYEDAPWAESANVFDSDHGNRINACPLTVGDVVHSYGAA